MEHFDNFKCIKPLTLSIPSTLGTLLIKNQFPTIQGNDLNVPHLLI